MPHWSSDSGAELQPLRDRFDSYMRLQQIFKQARCYWLHPWLPTKRSGSESHCLLHKIHGDNGLVVKTPTCDVGNLSSTLSVDEEKIMSEAVREINERTKEKQTIL